MAENGVEVTCMGDKEYLDSEQDSENEFFETALKGQSRP